MHDDVLWLKAFERGPVRVVCSSRARNGLAGLSVEFYGRSSRNRWDEAVRFDGYPGDVHVHWFLPDGRSMAKPLGGAGSVEEVLKAVRQGLEDELPALMTASGFPDTLSDAATRTDLVRVIEQEFFRVLAESTQDSAPVPASEA